MALEKAQITNTVTGENVPVMFNPEEYTTNRDINYSQTGVPGLSAPIIQFVHGNLQTLEMELFLDTYESHQENSRVINQAGDDVRKLTRKITDLMNIEATIHAPPVLLFTWGSLSFSFASRSMLRNSLKVTWRQRRSSARLPTTPSCTRLNRVRRSAPSPHGSITIPDCGGRLRSVIA